MRYSRPSAIRNPQWWTDDMHWNHHLAQYFGVKRSISSDLSSKPLKGQASVGIPECPGYLRLPGLVFGYLAMSYAYNASGCGNHNGLYNNYGLGGKVVNSVNLHVRENEVVCPGNTMAIGDAIPCYEDDFSDGRYHLGPHFKGYPFLYPIDTQGVIAMRILDVYPDKSAPNQREQLGRAAVRKRHGGRWNILFCDQHVENLTTTDVFDVRQDAIAQRWNRDQIPHNEYLK